MSSTVIGFKAIRKRLDDIGVRGRNLEPAFNKFADWFAVQEGEQFKSGGTRWGEGAWAPLTPEYAAWKARHGYTGGLLVRSGNLVDSLTRRPFGVERIRPTSVEFGTDVAYGKFLQDGTRKMVPRRFLPRADNPEVRHKMNRYVLAWVVRGK